MRAVAMIFDVIIEIPAELEINASYKRYKDGH
jgi:hypothetical protein